MRRVCRFEIERQGFMRFLKFGMSAWIAIGICAFAMGHASVYGVSNEAVLKATPDQFSFGTIPEGEPAVTVASVENISGAPVEITNVRTS